MASQEQVERALQNMHNWMASVMVSLKEMEDDKAFPEKHKLTLMVLRWDWEKINARCSATEAETKAL